MAQLVLPVVLVLSFPVCSCSRRTARPRPDARSTIPREAGIGAHARLSRAAAMEDVRQLAAILESSHPDPYLGGGGRIAFHRRVHRALDGIPAGGLTVQQLLRRLRPLVASVHDGHTQLRGVRSGSSRRMWVELDAVEERIHVAGVYREQDRPAVGQRVAAFNGVAWDELVARSWAFRGADNAYDNLRHLMQAMREPDLLEDLLGGVRLGDTIDLELESPGGARSHVTLPMAPLSGEPLRPPSRLSLPAPNAADLAWGFLAADRSAAILRVDSMMRYREAFEYWRSTGFVANLGEHLSDVVRRATGREAPRSVDARVELVPSATRMFQELFAAMREARTSALVVDLRRNGGGNSAMTMILGHFLYSPDELAATDDGYQIPRFSRLYFENNRAMSLEKLQSRWSLLQPGDLDFSEEQAWRTRPTPLSPDAAVVVEQQLARDAGMMPTFAVVRRESSAGPRWTGKVVVLTSASTYSAGFDLAGMLVKHGAVVVGVPSGQAGNCYIDGLAFRLTHSGLEGSVSYKRSLMFPDDSARGEMLRPQVELTYARLVAMQFDPDAPVRLALETLGR